MNLSDDGALVGQSLELFLSYAPGTILRYGIQITGGGLLHFTFVKI